MGAYIVIVSDLLWYFLCITPIGAICYVTILVCVYCACVVNVLPVRGLKLVNMMLVVSYL